MTQPCLEYMVALTTSTRTPVVCWKNANVACVPFKVFNLRVYLCDTRAQLSIHGPEHEPFVRHMDDVTLPKSFREVHGLHLCILSVEEHVQILGDQWIVLEARQ